MINCFESGADSATCFFSLSGAVAENDGAIHATSGAEERKYSVVSVICVIRENTKATIAKIIKNTPIFYSLYFHYI